MYGYWCAVDALLCTLWAPYMIKMVKARVKSGLSDEEINDELPDKLEPPWPPLEKPKSYECC